MKIKTSELIGPALDWAVNECEYRRIIAAGEYIKEGVLERHLSMRECQVHLDPLTALFRCYVASVLGNEVEIPEELI